MSSTAATASSMRYKYTSTPRPSAALDSPRAVSRLGWAGSVETIRPSFLLLTSVTRPGYHRERGASMNTRVYLDHNASTPVHPEVVQAMLPYFDERFGNPSSVHGFGREARDGVEAARAQVAGFLRVTADEIVFTSGGTESDNFAIKGVANARGRGHIITSQIEHHAVLRTCQSLEEQGFAVSYLPVDGHGMVDPDDVRRA